MTVLRTNGEAEQALQVEFAGQLGGQLLDGNAARHDVQNERGRHAAGQCMQQELGRVGAFVVDEQDGWLAIDVP